MKYLNIGLEGVGNLYRSAKNLGLVLAVGSLALLPACASQKQMTFEDPTIPGNFNIRGDFSVEYDEQGRVYKVIKDEGFGLFNEGGKRTWTYERPSDRVVVETGVNLNLKGEEDSVAPRKVVRKYTLDETGNAVEWSSTEDLDGDGTPEMRSEGSNAYMNIEQRDVVIKSARYTKVDRAGYHVGYLQTWGEYLEDHRGDFYEDRSLDKRPVINQMVLFGE